MAARGLGGYLSFTRAAMYQSSRSGSSRLRLVMGNPSADLDSFISAVVFSFFNNMQSRRHKTNTGSQDQSSFVYVPLINLADVPSKDLWRLRQEFGTAVGLAMGIGDGDQGKQKIKAVLEQLVTISDLRKDQESMFRKILSRSSATDESNLSTSSSEPTQKQEVVLVDHNVPSIPGISQNDIDERLDVVGCIDHHVDEKYISSTAKPRIITTGIGSCTSLVIKYLRDEGLWPAELSSRSEQTSDPKPSPEDAKDEEISLQTLQVAKLALAPVLIDTSNLKAPGEKCSDLDRETVSFLSEYINNHPASVQISKLDQPSKFDTTAFFNAISASKSNSLNQLTMPEIFERDYKEWTEQRQLQSNKEIRIGISSIVRQLDWLTKHAGSNEKFVSEIQKFIEAHDLGVYALLTKPNSSGKGREVVVIVASSSDDEGQGDKPTESISTFEEKGSEDLDLSSDWVEDEGFRKCMDSNFSEGRKRGRWKIWWQRDMSKTRKQVAPLLRAAVRDS